MILSPHVMNKSAFAGRDKIGEWPLYDYGGWAERRGGAAGAAGAVGEKGAKDVKPSNAVTFQTIRSFKGLEADIVFLTGIRAGSQACTLNDIYVGSSRERFLLYIFHEAGYRFG